METSYMDDGQWPYEGAQNYVRYSDQFEIAQRNRLVVRLRHRGPCLKVRIDILLIINGSILREWSGSQITHRADLAMSEG